jgi:uncharacterized membrane protein
MDKPPSPLFSLEMQVVLFGLGTAALTAAGTFFQKMNGVRGGNAFMSWWLVVATLCFFPTFLITNRVFQMGGRMSLYVPVTAAAYVLTMAAGRFYFGETVPWDKWLGCALIMVGVVIIAR